MVEQMLDDQLEAIYNSSMPMKDVKMGKLAHFPLDKV